MDTRLFFFEDDDYENFYPLTYTRPVYLLLCGAFPIWKKWAMRFKNPDTIFLCRGEIAVYTHEETGISCNRFDFEDCNKAIFINGRVLPSDELAESIEDARESTLFIDNGNLAAAVIIPGGMQAESLLRMNYWGYGHFKSVLKHCRREEVKSRRMGYIWDFIAENPKEIKSDFEKFSGCFASYDFPVERLAHEGCHVYEPGMVCISQNVRIDAQTVIDARGGPVIIDPDVHIAPHSHIEGPCYIGPGTQVMSARVREGCSFGPQCRVGGEVEESIFQGYSSKYHEGFIGHAFLGEWVNLGALTTNSDLKNNYGTIRVNNGIGEIDTGQIKVGSFIGDHVKTGIGMLLNTGISIGFGSNLFGGGLVIQKFIPPFVWGGPGGYSEYQFDKAIGTARKVLPRRGKELSPACSAMFKTIFEQSTEARNKFLGA